MNFDYTEEQQMVRDSIARFVQDDYDWDTRRAIVDGAEGMSRDNWQTFAELGWLSIPFAEADGGFGGSVIDLSVVMEELGKGLVVEPFFPTVVLFGGLVSRAGDEAQRSSILEGVIGGETLGAFAYVERQSRYALNDCKTSATSSGDGYTLNGEKVVVFNGENADKLVVLARTSGEQFDAHGLSLFLVDANAQGVSKVLYPMMDAQRVANITFDNVQLGADALLGDAGSALEVVNAVIRDALLALASEAVGIMATLNAKTLEYTKTREQFGVAIGSFQALQHRMVDTMMAFEQSKSLLFKALCEYEIDPASADTTIHALKVLIDRNSKLVYGEAIQMHGGMGITDELDIGHYAKRLMMINATLGDGSFHRSKFIEQTYAA
ncbi:acyl-CoA dehydrogenase family protein [Luminiphilus sp.]|jgi:alkylation response protein AidB-like acyl-CoA dehydrogenase|nr:acyl-CoA dehydrogenase family protein [Luminiphilus sp.]MDA8663033.1 acyl-CoA dehydrogenase family protein [Luminiphilus sp.]MDA8946282.1 acyl-CoA dehydrogenase family protein [Luminiphilus sp.]MDB2440717.1 acyl-CoA dehydrogenase family protein [Luminiphilus sp.]MDB2622721.1 acyl-CoA dehydrogenase family protein [Luminiphilus sp.]